MSALKDQLEICVRESRRLGLSARLGRLREKAARKSSNKRLPQAERARWAVIEARLYDACEAMTDIRAHLEWVE